MLPGKWYGGRGSCGQMEERTEAKGLREGMGGVLGKEVGTGEVSRSDRHGKMERNAETERCSKRDREKGTDIETKKETDMAKT